MHPLLKFSLFAILLLTFAVSAQEPTDVFRGCGERLSEMLSFVCKDIFNKKRSDPDTSKTNVEDLNGLYRYDSKVNANEASIYHPLMSPHTHSFLTKSARYRRDNERFYITEECCMKSCTISEIQGYCGPRS